MATLKSTIKLESSDLFPSPLAFTVVNNNTVAGDYSSFSTLTFTDTAQQLNMHAIDGASSSAYCYFSTPTTNSTPVYIAYEGVTGSPFVRLAPGDVAFLPVGDTASTADLVAFTTTSTASLSYFIGNKD